MWGPLDLAASAALASIARNKMDERPTDFCSMHLEIFFDTFHIANLILD